MTKTYLVSGASAGIGRAIALALSQASANHCIVLLGRNIEKLLETKTMLACPEQHHVIQADLRDANTLKKAFADARLESKNLCGIIANAGIANENHYGSEDSWDDIINTNLTGTYRLVNEALPYLRKSTEPYRHIVVTSSILARIGVPKYSAYCASKSGLLGLMRSWAMELADEKILVNAICPGWVATDMAKKGITRFATQAELSYEQALSEQLKFVPLAKMSEAQEIAALVRYLVSKDQISITGQAIDINNGAWMA